MHHAFARRYILILILFFSELLSSLASATARDQPNIILILADDVGIGNVGCTGGHNFKTPNIDQLARQGILFKNAYSTPLCGPSRTSLLTGRYPFRTGADDNDTTKLLSPGKEVFVSSMLKEAGYVTGQVGKWQQLPGSPSDWGFDESLTFRGHGKYWSSDVEFYTKNGVTRRLRPGQYLPDVMSEFASDFARRHRNTPFFLYYAMSHVHLKISRTPDSPWKGNDFYKDNISYMDKLVGKLVRDLEKQGLREKTVIIFAGDNGPTRYYAPRATVGGSTLEGYKGKLQEGGSRVPFIASWIGTTPNGVVNNDLVDFTDLVPTLLELAKTKQSDEYILDGTSFAPQLRGKQGTPREWIYVQLGQKAYVRNNRWKLTHDNQLYDMRFAPFAEAPVSGLDTSPEIERSRRRLQTILLELKRGKNPPRHQKAWSGN